MGSAPRRYHVTAFAQRAMGVMSFEASVVCAFNHHFFGVREPASPDIARGRPVAMCSHDFMAILFRGESSINNENFIGCDAQLPLIIPKRINLSWTYYNSKFAVVGPFP
jgi:hypothetical protein